MSSRVLYFYPERLKQKLMNEAVKKQNKRLIDYAKKTIIEIGNEINRYNSSNHMDRTGNLLNSVCWGVSYQGNLVDYGFYKKTPTTHPGRWANGWTDQAELHEWSGTDISSMYPVNGRKLAEEYIQKIGNTGSRGWKVFFAVLAPYWGYWEQGFSMPSGFGSSRLFRQFAVMTQFFDKIRQDLKPARKYYFNVSIPPKIDKSTAMKKATS